MLNPCFEEIDLVGGEAGPGRRHAGGLIIGLDAEDQFTGSGISGNDRGGFGVSAFQRGFTGIEFEASLIFVAVATETVLAEDGEDVGVEVFGLLGIGLGSGFECATDFGVDKGIDGMSLAGWLYFGESFPTEGPVTGCLMTSRPEIVLGGGGSPAIQVIKILQGFFDASEGRFDGGIGEGQEFAGGAEDFKGVTVRSESRDGDFTGFGAVTFAADDEFQDDPASGRGCCVERGWVAGREF